MSREGKNTRVDGRSLLKYLYNPGIEPRSPALQEDSLPSELLGKPKSTGVDLHELLVYFGNLSFVSCFICFYFLPF